MLFKVILVTVLAVVAAEQETGRRHRCRDPFAALDHHLSHSLSMQYLWPWTELFQAAAALDAEKTLEEPEIIPDPNKFQIHLNVRRFKPEELSVKAGQRYVTVEGKHMVTNSQNKNFLANHFLQQFALPPGSKAEEVTAELNGKGILTLSAPKHELPPPPPERDVPIIVKVPETKPETKPTDTTEVDSSDEIKEELTTPKAEQTNETVNKPVLSAEAPVKKVEDEFSEQTTHVNKIRKKELKTSSAKSNKDNEVTKGLDENGLDYALMETE